MGDSVGLLGAVAVRPAVSPLVPAFETATGLSVATRWALNPAVKQQIEAGEQFDLVVTNPDLVEALTGAGLVLPESRVPFGRISMGVATRRGSRRFSVETLEAFGQALRDAKSIAYAGEGSSGAYFRGLLERLGLAAEVSPLLVPVAGGDTATSVARGEAELAVVPVTSILAAGPDVVLAGRFPSELESHIEFDIGISAAAANLEGARRLSAFLTSREVDAALAVTGLERRA